MNIPEQMSHISLELKQLQKELKGINPKLSTYQKIQARIKELETLQANLGAKKAYAGS